MLEVTFGLGKLSNYKFPLLGTVKNFSEWQDWAHLPNQQLTNRAKQEVAIGNEEMWASRGWMEQGFFIRLVIFHEKVTSLYVDVIAMDTARLMKRANQDDWTSCGNSATDSDIPVWSVGLGMAKKKAMDKVPIMPMEKEGDTGVGHLIRLVIDGKPGAAGEVPHQAGTEENGMGLDEKCKSYATPDLKEGSVKGNGNGG